MFTSNNQEVSSFFPVCKMIYISGLTSNYFGTLSANYPLLTEQLILISFDYKCVNANKLKPFFNQTQ